jgi:hypothetical protein
MMVKVNNQSPNVNARFLRQQGDVRWFLPSDTEVQSTVSTLASWAAYVDVHAEALAVPDGPEWVTRRGKERLHIHPIFAV